MTREHTEPENPYRLAMQMLFIVGGILFILHFTVAKADKILPSVGFALVILATVLGLFSPKKWFIFLVLLIAQGFCFYTFVHSAT